MMTKTQIISPDFMEPSGWRNVVQNNADVKSIPFTIVSGETWLPKILSEAGFFPSNSEVKKNRPDLWRDAQDGEVVKLSWAKIRTVLVSPKKVFADDND